MPYSARRISRRCTTSMLVCSNPEAPDEALLVEVLYKTLFAELDSYVDGQILVQNDRFEYVGEVCQISMDSDGTQLNVRCKSVVWSAGYSWQTAWSPEEGVCVESGLDSEFDGLFH